MRIKALATNQSLFASCEIMKVENHVDLMLLAVLCLDEAEAYMDQKMILGKETCEKFEAIRQQIVELGHLKM